MLRRISRTRALAIRLLAPAALWLVWTATLPAQADLPAAPSVAAAVPDVPAPDAPAPTHSSKPFALPDDFPAKPSIAPLLAIPVEPLGFSAPAAYYLGMRNSFVSLDFLDEDHLLFTFRVPGLIRRQGGQAAEDERRIRAVVLSLPSGRVQAEALWTVHDRERYLWPLDGGRFLLRDQDALMQGGLSLELKPYLRFPGPLHWIETDPSAQLLVADSREPDPANASAATEPQTDDEHPADLKDFRLRIIRRDSGKVLLTSRARSVAHLPINADGYLEPLRTSAAQWMVVLNSFSGGNAVLGRVDSTCVPLFEFLAPQVVLATGCTASGSTRLVALTTSGRRLWEDTASDHSVWPLTVRAASGLRLIRQTLAVGRAVSLRTPLDISDIKGQLVLVLNTLDGQPVLVAPASPTFDAGGNAALSPSGRRAAILNAGALQIFDLPPAPPLPPAPAR